jgi:hypothetical protein
VPVTVPVTFAQVAGRYDSPLSLAAMSSPIVVAVDDVLNATDSTFSQNWKTIDPLPVGFVAETVTVSVASALATLAPLLCACAK